MSGDVSMTEDLFLDWALKLLEQIETSEEKKLWCRRYSVYSRSPGQETLARDLHDFVDRTYQAGDPELSRGDPKVGPRGAEYRDCPSGMAGDAALFMCIGLYRMAFPQRPFLRGFPDQSKHRGRSLVTPVSSAQSALSHSGSRRHTTRTLL